WGGGRGGGARRWAATRPGRGCGAGGGGAPGAGGGGGGPGGGGGGGRAAAAPAVTRVLALTGVDKLIPVYPSVAAALAGREDADPGDDVAADPPDDAVPSAHPE